MTVTIRPATEGDIDAMYALSCAVHLTPLYQKLIPKSHRDEFIERFTPKPEQLETHRDRMRRHLADPDWFIWVADDENGRICGFASARQVEGMYKLKGLFVDEAFQGQGIGRQLFNVACEAAPVGQPIVLDVIAENKRAIEIYIRAGFRPTDYVPDPYYGAPMVRMQKY